MRNFIFSILFTLMSASLMGQTTYYVKNGGNDGAAGTSPATAWATLSKVSGETFSAGDSILLERGSVWREEGIVFSDAGSDGNWIYIGDYGIGNKPIINGALTDIDWIATGTSNIWRTTGSSYTDPYLGTDDHDLVIVDGSNDTILAWGQRVYDAGFTNLDEEFEWCFNGGVIYLYSPTDPDIRYISVDIPQYHYGISLEGGVEYLKIENLNLYAMRHSGIRDPFTMPTPEADSYLTIENCEISWIGRRESLVGYGIYLNYSELLIRGCNVHHCGRRGLSYKVDGAGNTLNSHNIVIENNRFHHGYHTTGLDMNRESLGITDSVIIRNNIFYEDPDYDFTGREASSSNAIYFENGENGAGNGSVWSNIYIYNNVFHTLGGRGVQFEFLDTLYIANNTFYGWSSFIGAGEFFGMSFGSQYTSQIYLMNNLYYNNAVYANNPDLISFFLSNNTDNMHDSVVYCDHNLYYNTDVNVSFADINDIVYHINDSSNFRSNLGWGINSVFKDPYFSNTTITDLSVADSSPAVDAGLSLSWITTDILGNSRDVLTPTIGAFEYQTIDSTTTDILTFTLVEQTGVATINATLHTISIEVSYGTDVSTLTPTITLSQGATINPESGIERDFTDPVNYIVTALDGETQQVWSVIVNVAEEVVTPIVIRKVAMSNNNIFIAPNSSIYKF